MIVKSFELDRIDYKKNKNYLFHGDNISLVNEIIEKKFKSNFKDKIYHYEENEILENEKEFFDKILSRSFFEDEKLLIISRSTDKILKVAEEVVDRKIEDVIFIFIANILEKKSKLRGFFEKKKETISVAFYPDNQKTLSILVNNFFKKIKVSVSQEIINIIVEKSNGNRQNLNNELAKIENLTIEKKRIELDDITKLIRVSENNSISELVDFCLAKNQKKIIKIMNENNFSRDDTILIIRTFLSKTKRLIKLKNSMQQNKNIDNVISNFKPPIFWKDKELVKQQLDNWSDKNIRNLLQTINENELLIKKNFESSLRILLNFVFTTVQANQ